MEPRTSLRTLAGSLAVATTLALSLPSVRAAQAEPGSTEAASAAATQPSTPPAASSCRVGAPAAVPAKAADLSSIEARLRQALAAEGEDVIVLNTKGYGYHAPTQVGGSVRQRLEREAAAQRARQAPLMSLEPGTPSTP